MPDLVLQAKNVSKDEKIVLRRERKNPTPPFHKWGDSMSYNGSSYPAFKDITGVMKGLSKGAHWMFWQLLELREIRTNISVFTPKDEYEKKRVARAYKELKEAEIIVRVRRSHYMFNPAVWQPQSEFYEEVFLEWTRLTKEKS